MLVGRDSEMTQLEEVLREGKHGLVVISSKPGMGRSALLEELRSRAKNLNWRILPGGSKEEESDGSIAINWETTEKDFRGKVSFTPPLETKADDSRIQAPSTYMTSVVPESAKKGVSPVSAQSADTALHPLDIQQSAPQEGAGVLTPSGIPKPTTEVKKVFDGTLILIDGYQPDKEFETWFLGSYIPEMKRETSPVVIVVAGYSGDLAPLTETADRIIDLGTLPLQATTEYFRNLNDHIEEKMEEKEIQAYADKSATDPSLIDALTRLLQLR